MSDEAASHYTLLGIPPLAEAETIRVAFRRRIREAHPDVNRAPGAAELTAQLTEAFRVLSNPIARSVYDGELRRQRLMQLTKADLLLHEGHPPTPVAPSTATRLGRLSVRVALFLLILGGVAGAAWQVGIPWAVDGTDTISVATYAPASSMPVTVAARTLAPGFQTEAALAVPPVRMPAIHLAMRKFEQVSWSRGMTGAAAFSLRCHAIAARMNTWDSADFCAAFDHAGYLVVGGSDDAASRAAAGYFIDRHTDQARYYDNLAAEQMLIDAHLDRLRATFAPTEPQSAPSALQSGPAG